MFYNLDAVISVGYRVNSIRATLFRQWATSVLREFAIRGYVLDKKRMENGLFLGHLLTPNRSLNSCNTNVRFGLYVPLFNTITCVSAVSKLRSLPETRKGVIKFQQQFR